jgi:hypothetical protein
LKRLNVLWALATLFLALATGCDPLEAPAGSLAPFRPALQPAWQGDLTALTHLPRYAIALEADVAAQTLRGEEEVIYRNLTRTPLKALSFRLYPNLPQHGGQMHVEKVVVAGRAVLPSLEEEETALRVPLPGALQPDEAVALTVTFSATVPLREGEERVLFGISQGIWNLPDAYPLLAVWEKEGWREEIAPPHGDPVFSEMALYNVAIQAPAGWTVAASGTTTGVEKAAGDTQIWHISGGPLREFALVLSDGFQTARTSVGGTTVTSYYLKEDQEAGKAALWHTAAALRAYSLLYGAYPYTELDVVEAPLSARGQEYSGLIELGTALYRDERKSLEFLAAHEMAHQWWYNLVGSDPWTHPWLDEGLAEYSTYDYYRMVYGRGAAQELLLSRWQNPYDYAVKQGRDGAVDRPAANFDAGSYQLLVYAKAALFLNALREEVGDDTYLTILREYLAEERYGVATPQRFLAIAQRVSGRNLNPLAERWLQGRESSR